MHLKYVLHCTLSLQQTNTQLFPLVDQSHGVPLVRVAMLGAEGVGCVGCPSNTEDVIR